MFENCSFRKYSTLWIYIIDSKRDNFSGNAIFHSIGLKFFAIKIQWSISHLFNNHFLVPIIGLVQWRKTKHKAWILSSHSDISIYLFPSPSALKHLCVFVCLCVPLCGCVQLSHKYLHLDIPQRPLKGLKLKLFTKLHMFINCN